MKIHAYSSSLKIPLCFIITGILEMTAFFITAVLFQSDIHVTAPRSPYGWGLTHLFVLGWASMIAMGAVYQLVPVVLNQSLFSQRMGGLHYVFYLVGHTGLIFGFFFFNPRWIAVFCTLLFLAILLFVLNIGITLLRAGQWNPVTLHAGSALVCLILTASSGMFMGFDFTLGKLGVSHDQLLYTHIWLGVAGWFGNLIIGFSYKLLPMFSISHNHPVQWQNRTFILFNLAVAGGALSNLTGIGPWSRFSIMLLAVAFCLYVYALHQIRQAGIKKNPGAGIHFTLRVNLLTALCLLGFAVGSFFVSQPSFFILTVWIGLWGWVYLTIIGYLSKIVPFLWWTFQYGNQVGKNKVPLLSEMIQEKKLKRALYVVGFAFLGTVPGIVTSSTFLFQAGFLLFSLSSLYAISTIGNVFTFRSKEEKACV